MQFGMSVSHVARLYGINANQIFKWRKQYESCSLTALKSGEDVVPVSELAAANKQTRELQRLLGKKTMEAEVLKEAVQDVMLGGVEKRFRQNLPSAPLEWLTDNGSAYRAHETRTFVRMFGVEPSTTAVRSPENNGIAESFVKTIKRDYISITPKPDSRTALVNLAALQ